MPATNPDEPGPGPGPGPNGGNGNGNGGGGGGGGDRGNGDAPGLDKAAELLMGSHLEVYATVGGERRQIPMITGDLDIDPNDGSLTVGIVPRSDQSGLRGAFIVEDDGALVPPDGYDTFEVVFYGYETGDTTPDLDAPIARYVMEDVSVAIDPISFPMDRTPVVEVHLTPYGWYGFR